MPHVGREGCTSVVWSYHFRLTRKQDASQKQWNILLTIMISAIYLHQHQESLAAHRQGHPATAVHTAMKFSSWIERRVGNERGHDTPAQRLKPMAGPSHRPGRVKPLRSLHIPWYPQAKLLAAKGQIHPSSGTHTTTEMLKHSLVPHTGGSCQVSHQRVPLQIRYWKDFSASQRAETWQDSLLHQLMLLQKVHLRAQINLQGSYPSEKFYTAWTKKMLHV